MYTCVCVYRYNQYINVNVCELHVCYQSGIHQLLSTGGHGLVEGDLCTTHNNHITTSLTHAAYVVEQIIRARGNKVCVTCCMGIGMGMGMGGGGKVCMGMDQCGCGDG